MKEPIVVSVDQLIQEPYASVLCFPNPDKTEVQSRIQELSSLGITAIEFSGTANVFGVGVPVLGKGFVGIVVIAHLNGKRFAVKIRRTDADRANLLHEALMLSKANSANVAPKLEAASKNFLVMQLIDGDLLPNWLKKTSDETAVKEVLEQVLEQCFKLDQIGLDHGELSKAPKHLLVDQSKRIFIVDFETASIERRVANVTAVCQYLFAGNSSASKILADILGERNRLDFIDILKNYKKNKNREAFEKLFNFCLA
ncbi:MAG TPA: RIO1 family regulatory kinase/ATPase [Candidatus Acidoferrum sp.]|nr:RIO1 family regulatory kinase/ATPase [Candidatus Acidoferrum sp.]